jgi:hypothetical protein
MEDGALEIGKEIRSQVAERRRERNQFGID